MIPNFPIHEKCRNTSKTFVHHNTQNLNHTITQLNKLNNCCSMSIISQYIASNRLHNTHVPRKRMVAENCSCFFPQMTFTWSSTSQAPSEEIFFVFMTSINSSSMNLTTAYSADIAKSKFRNKFPRTLSEPCEQ